MRQIVYMMQLLVLAMLMATAVPTVAITGTPSWKPRETVDSFVTEGQHYGSDRLLAYEHFGSAGIAFVDGDLSLDYARYVPGIGWAQTEVDPNTALNPSLAFDRYERPAISYSGGPSSELQIAHFDGSAWQLGTVDNVSTSRSALAFDSLGRPAIAYTRNASITLHYVYDTDGDFSFTDETPVTVAGGLGEGYFPSLAFDHLNRPMIAHFDIPNSEALFSIEEPGLGWLTSSVAVNVSGPPSLAIDPDTGFPAIAFGGGGSGLRFAAWDGTTWDTVVVDATANVGSLVSLAFDPADGHPAISYNDNASSELNFAWHNGSVWQTQNVDSGGLEFRQSSLAFNDFGNGFASIAYMDEMGQLFFIEDPPAVVPEPASALLMLSGTVCVLLRRRNISL